MSRLRQRLFAATLATLAAASAPAARAQQPAAAAQALLDEGNRAASTGDFATALERFRAAYARYPSPSILINIGTALRRLGRGPEAAVVYEKYLRDPGATPERAAEVRRWIGEIDATIARVTIGASDMGARVWVDGGELVGFAPGGSVRLAPGQHTIAAGRDAPYASEVIRVEAGEARSVFLRLATVSPPAPPPIPPPPVVVVMDRPGAADEDPEYPAGRRARSRWGEARPSRRARAPMGPLKITGAVLSTFGGLGIAGSMAAGIVALVQDRAASRHCLGGGPACEPRALELERSSVMAARASAILLGIGGALATTGGILQAIDRGVQYGARDDARARRAPLPRVGLAPTPGGAFMTLEATW